MTTEHMKKVTSELRVLPEVVVLPETNETSTGTTKTGGSINTDTTFDCSSINLRKGSKGEDVKKLQTILKARGYYNRQVDGNFGKYTQNAVKKLQKAQGNTSDGVFGPKTCNKLQQTSTTSNKATGTNETKNKPYIITNIKSNPSISYDLEGLSNEITLTIPYDKNIWAHLRQLQKTEYKLIQGNETIITHTGYINTLKINYEDDTFLIEIGITGYNTFLEQSINYEKTAKRSELLKDLITMAGLKANIDMAGLPDTEYTIKNQTESTSSGTGSKTVSDCFDMAKEFIHPYHDGKYQTGSSTHDPDTAWNAYQQGTRHFDCFGTSAFLFYTIKNFAKKGVRVIWRHSSAAKSGTHFTVQIKENGSWVDPKTEYNKLDKYLRVSSGTAHVYNNQQYEG